MARLGDTIVIGDLNVTGDINAGGKFGITGLLNLFYPVGSYYETSDVNFDPNVSWGGTWVQDTVGLTTIAADTVGDTDLAKTNNRVRISLGEILGEKNHTITINEMPSHDHPTPAESNTSNGRFYMQNIASNYYANGSPTLGNTSLSTWQWSKGVVSQGGSQSHNNVQPSIGVVRWHRIS